MTCHFTHRGVMVVLAVVAVTVATASVSLANPVTSVVKAGFDLFETQPGTTLVIGSPIFFEGVGLGTFDFGDGNGAVSVGNTDTIIDRKQDADPNSDKGTHVSSTFSADLNSGVIDIELVALQLKSVDPINLGMGLDFHYVTLQNTPSTGEMKITFDDPSDPATGGTFDSFFDVFFDIRLGALDGMVLFSDTLRLSSENVPWGRVAPPLAITIPDINFELLGPGNINGDFWPALFEETHPDGAVHSVGVAVVPVPTAAWMGLVLLGGMGAVGVVRRGEGKRGRESI